MITDGLTPLTLLPATARDLRLVLQSADPETPFLIGRSGGLCERGRRRGARLDHVAVRTSELDW